MDAERVKMMEALAKHEADSLAGIQETVDKGLEGIEQARQEAIDRIQADNDKALQRIDKQTATMLKQIEEGKVKSIRRLERMVNATCTRIEGTVDSTERKYDRHIAKAKRKAKAEVGKRAAEVKAQGKKAVEGLDAHVLKAEQAIDQLAVKTGAEITAEVGRQDLLLQKEGDKLDAALVAAGSKAVGELKVQGGKARARIKKRALKDIERLKRSSARLEGQINNKWVGDAVREAESKLTRSHIFDAVTDAESIHAMNTLAGLPKDVRGKAMGRLSDDHFDELLTEVPAERREQFKDLYDVEPDAERKLALFGEFHKSRARNEAVRREEKVGTWDFSAEGRKKTHRNEARDGIADNTEAEVDEEMAHLLEQIKAGKAGVKDVEALEGRKTKELDVELKHGIKLTNDLEKEDWWIFQKPEARTKWSEDELARLDRGLSGLRTEDTIDNPNISEINRGGVRTDWDKSKGVFGGWEESKSTGADAGGGVITMYDNGADPTSGLWRADEESKLGGHKKPTNPGDPDTSMTLMEEIIAHEMGHIVHQNDAKPYDDYKKAAGWEEGLGTSDLVARFQAGPPPMSKTDAEAQVAGLESKRKDHYTTRPSVTIAGKVYIVDPYSGNFLAYKEGAIPDGAGIDRADSGDQWGYARSNAKDHFAEHYMKAIHNPEKLHEDMIATPKKEADRTEAAFKASETRLTALKAPGSGATPAQIAAEEAAVTKARQARDKAKDVADVRKSQWDTMRDDVFKADDSDIQALTAPKGKEAVYKQYKEEAAQCVTPQQLDALRAAYKGKL